MMISCDKSELRKDYLELLRDQAYGPLARLGMVDLPYLSFYSLFLSLYFCMELVAKGRS